MDLKNQVRTKKIAKKSFFRLNFEVLLINRYFEISCGHCNLLEF